MHDTTPEVTGFLAELARMRAVRDRAAAACDRAYANLEGQGFSRRAVDRALDLLDVGADDHKQELEQARVILDAMRSPVQIEMVSLYETPISEDRHLLDVQDAGYWAAFQGMGRTYRGASEAERRAWFKGYDMGRASLDGKQEGTST